MMRDDLYFGHLLHQAKDGNLTVGQDTLKPSCLELVTHCRASA